MCSFLGDERRTTRYFIHGKSRKVKDGLIHGTIARAKPTKKREYQRSPKLFRDAPGCESFTKLVGANDISTYMTSSLEQPSTFAEYLEGEDWS
jgi:hypothetical protein